MKLSRLLLLGSLGANAVLVAVLALRPDSPGGGAHGSSAPAPVISPPGAVSAADPRDSTLQAALASGDDAALAAAGVSPEIRRALAIGRAFDKMQKRIQELRPHSPTTKNTGADRD